MPELPEVETVRRGLDTLVVGRQIMGVTILNPKSFQDPIGESLPLHSPSIQEHIVGATIRAIRRRAKVLILDLSSDFSLLIHLKMTGQIVLRDADENWGAGHPTRSYIHELPDASTRVEFDLDKTAKLFFNDQRKFGWIRLVPTLAIEQLPLMAKLGPEPLSGKTEKEFIGRARKHQNARIKAVLLDQTVVAGIGNIYADEALWGAKVHPATRVKDLSDVKLKNILAEAIIAMKKSLSIGGSTMRNYIKPDGTKGNYLDKFANVFRRDGQPCPRCGTEIVKIRMAGRGTHICPHCQVVKND